MATWAEFAAASPELAEAGRALLFHPGVGFGYLATVRADGSPQVHPVMPLIADGRLEVFVVPSPKLADLRRDGRYALHSAQDEHVNDEFCVEGRAEIVDGEERRAAALAAHPASVGDDHVLVELGVDRALLAQYATPPAWPPSYRSWSVGG
jgi:hypothetical protein